MHTFVILGADCSFHAVGKQTEQNLYEQREFRSGKELNIGGTARMVMVFMLTQYAYELAYVVIYLFLFRLRSFQFRSVNIIISNNKKHNYIL